jgi:hypothetical protein
VFWRGCAIVGGDYTGCHCEITWVYSMRLVLAFASFTTRGVPRLDSYHRDSCNLSLIRLTARILGIVVRFYLFPPLRSPVPEGLSTGTQGRDSQLALLTYSTCYTCNLYGCSESLLAFPIEMSIQQSFVRNKPDRHELSNLSIISKIISISISTALFVPVCASGEHRESTVNATKFRIGSCIPALTMYLQSYGEEDEESSQVGGNLSQLGRPPRDL